MSRRNHQWREGAFECGEVSQCSIAWGPIIGGLVGGGLGLLGAKEKADAIEYAADRNREATTPKFYGPGLSYVPNILSEAQRLYGGQGFAPEPHPVELLGRQNMLEYGEGTLPGLIGAAQASWQRGLDPGLDPYVGAMIESAQHDLTQDYLRNVLPSISDRAQAVGGYGGSRQGVAQGIASEGLLESLGDISTNLLSRAYRDSLGQQRAAWQAAPSLTALGYLPSQTQIDVGGMYRADAGLPAQNLQGYAGMVNPYIDAGQGRAVYPYNQPSMLGAGLGGAVTGARLGGWIGNALSPSPWAPMAAVGSPSGGAAPAWWGGSGAPYGLF